MSSYTPGPWEARRNNAFWEVNPVNGAGDNGIPFTVADVCLSAPDDPDGGLQEANARLIAAAPDLLEALREYIGADEVAHGYQCGVGGEVMLRARAAIARATGEDV